MAEGLFTNSSVILPADIVLAPAWWYHNAGITFGEDFFYDPVKRVEAERRMEQVLYEKWGRFGLGEDKDKDLPVVGAVHLAAGYLLSEMLGCKVEFKQDNPPLVIPANRKDLAISAEAAFETAAYKKFEKLVEALEKKFGYVVGDVGFAAILNVAIDLRGETLFLDMFDKPDEVKHFFSEIAAVIEKFCRQLQEKTGSTSIGVNRNVRNLPAPVFVHSECSHTMISTDHYEQFLFEYDVKWGREFRPFGIHFCGADPHRYAETFAKLPVLDFLDVGWGGDVAHLRKHLPDTFLNVRLSPVEIIDYSTEQIADTIRRHVAASANPRLTGVCCINMDEKVADEKITAIFETVAKLRKQYRDS